MTPAEHVRRAERLLASVPEIQPTEYEVYRTAAWARAAAEAARVHVELAALKLRSAL